MNDVIVMILIIHYLKLASCPGIQIMYISIINNLNDCRIGLIYIVILKINNVQSITLNLIIEILKLLFRNCKWLQVTILFILDQMLYTCNCVEK